MDTVLAKQIEIFADVATVAAGVIALLTFITGVIEYSRQGAQKRAEHFLEMRKRLKDNQTFKHICDLLEGDNPELLNVSFKDKRDLLGFFEEVALMMNSNLIRREVAHYMFGYYAIRCWQSENFWSNVARNSMYWKLFRDFAIEMEKVEKSFSFNSAKFKF